MTITSEHSGNPLIESLGNLPSDFGTLARRLTPEVRLPDCGIRQASIIVRFQALAALEDVYIPTMETLVLALKVRKMIERGYQRRKPNATYWSQHQATAQALASSAAPPAGSSSAPTFAVIGTSGRGKTTGIDMAISLMPSCIEHDQTRNPLLPRYQVPTVMVQCPVNRTPKSFILAFFEKIHELTGIDYRQALSTRASDDVLIVEMGRIARLHFIGLLIIDEIQELAGSDTRLRSLIVRITNTIKVPILFSGTPRAAELLEGDLPTARRFTGELWYPFQKDDQDWVDVLDGIWRYQYTRTPTQLDRELREKMHWLTCGIPALAKSLYAFAQEHLIINSDPTDPETITPQIMEKVFHAKMSSVIPAMEALRAGKGLDAHCRLMPDTLPAPGWGSPDAFNDQLQLAYYNSAIRRARSMGKQSAEMIVRASNHDPAHAPAL